MGHAGMGRVIQRLGGVGHAVKQPNNYSPQNQDLTPQKSFLEGVLNPSFEYKNYYYYYNLIISIVLYSECLTCDISNYSVKFSTPHPTTHCG